MSPLGKQRLEDAGCRRFLFLRRKERKVKGIKCCGECTYYSLKTHKCTAGAKDTGKAEDPFYKDCQFPDAVPTDELIQLRNDLYDTDAITMKGLKRLNELIFKYMGRADNG